MFPIFNNFYAKYASPNSSSRSSDTPGYIKGEVHRQL